jgi:hypothetical protein
MTPLQAAKAHCANYQPNASCLAIALKDDLSIYHFRKEGLPCALHACEACPYFEEIVLPQVPAGVAEQYRKSLPADAATTVRPQRSIKLCPTCAKIRSRRFKREHMRRKRGSDVEKQEISPIGAQALTKAKITIGDHHPQTSVLPSNFSTGQATSPDAPKADGTVNITREPVAP